MKIKSQIRVTYIVDIHSKRFAEQVDKYGIETVKSDLKRFGISAPVVCDHEVESVEDIEEA